MSVGRPYLEVPLDRENLGWYEDFRFSGNYFTLHTPDYGFFELSPVNSPSLFIEEERKDSNSDMVWCHYHRRVEVFCFNINLLKLVYSSKGSCKYGRITRPNYFDWTPHMETEPVY
jgi:hypothetical protein